MSKYLLAVNTKYLPKCQNLFKSSFSISIIFMFNFNTTHICTCYSNLLFQKLLNEMKERNYKADLTTFNSILLSLSRMAAYPQTQKHALKTLVEMRNCGIGKFFVSLETLHTCRLTNFFTFYYMLVLLIINHHIS